MLSHVLQHFFLNVHNAGESTCSRSGSIYKDVCELIAFPNLKCKKKRTLKIVKERIGN